MADDASPTAPAGERALWSTRLLLLGGVAGSAVLAAATIWIGTVDLVRFVGAVADYTTAGQPSEVRSELVADAVKVVDAYLLAAILVVVAFGLYELFIGRLDSRRHDADSPRLLVASSLDELKDRISKLVVLILVIEFFQRGLQIGIDDANDLVLLAGGIALVSLALVLPTIVDALRRPPQPGDKNR